MGKRALLALMIALLSSSTPSFAQNTRIDPPLAGPAQPADARPALHQGDDASGPNDHAHDERRRTGRAPVDPSADDVDVTVGRGDGSLDRAPRDIREPFDE